MSTRATVLLAAVSFAIGIQTYQLSAGAPGTVTIPPVIEVNATESGSATDGEGGYKPRRGIGVGYLNGAVTVSGNSFTYSAGGTPSGAVSDSGVTITYRGPLPGEAEYSASASCTVVDLRINRATVYGFRIVVGGLAHSWAVITVSGTARPAGLGGVNITGTPRRGIWNPSPAVMIGQPVNYEASSTTDLAGGGNPIGVGFDIEANYAGIIRNVFRICRRPFLWW